jgi:hypothetical protein
LKSTMIENLTCEQFAQHLGSTFQLHIPPQVSLALTLVEATPYTANFGELESMRSQRLPFSLIFQGPLETALPQRTYPLEHAEMGNMDIFLVPIARRQDGMYYEAIFT